MIEQGKLAKVIGGLDACLEGLCEACSYRNVDAPGGCKDALMYDAITLLKAQEQMRPGLGIIHHDDGSKSYFLHCPFDGVTLIEGDNYCRRCGRPVKWE